MDRDIVAGLDALDHVLLGRGMLCDHGLTQ